MQATFDKKPTPRDCALNRILEQKADRELELKIYKGTLAIIMMAALSNLMGWV